MFPIIQTYCDTLKIIPKVASIKTLDVHSTYLVLTKSKIELSVNLFIKNASSYLIGFIVIFKIISSINKIIKALYSPLK